MRIGRLDLIRYGLFTDDVIEFGPQDKQGDIHVILGPNEAGKSTMTHAILDLLFGFEDSTPYSFKHGNTLRIGARCEFQADARELVRVKSGPTVCWTRQTLPWTRH